MELLEKDNKTDSSLVDNLPVVQAVKRKGQNGVKTQGNALVKENRDSFLYTAFVRAYVGNGFNGRAAALAVNPKLNPRAADSFASRAIRRPEVKEAILQSMLPLEDDLNIIKEAQRAKREDKIGWADLHRFTETSLKLKGLLSKEEKGQSKVNIGLVFN